jgi:hypothetical protein
MDLAVASLDASVTGVEGDMSTLRSDVSTQVSGIESTLLKTGLSAHVSNTNKLKTDTATLSSGLSRALPQAHIVNSLVVGVASSIAMYHPNTTCTA